MARHEPRGDFQLLLNRLPLPVAQVLRRAAVTRGALERHNLSYFALEAMLKLSASWRVGVYLEHALDPGSGLAQRLEHLLLPSTGHWLGFLRELSAVLADEQPPVGIPFLDLHRKLIGRERDWTAVPAFHEGVARHEVLPPQLLTDARRRGVLGFLTVLVAYRNAVMAHGSGRLPSYYEEMGPLLFEAVCEVVGSPALIGELDLAVARLSVVEGGGSAEVSWQVLRGLASLPLSVVLEKEKGANAGGITPLRVYAVGPDVRVPLHPLVVFVEEGDGRERVGILNRAEEGTSTPELPTVRRVEFLDYVRGEPLEGVEVTGELAALLGRLRGMGSEPGTLRETVSGLQQELGVGASWLLEPGTVLGDFEVEHELGRGGMGVVYRGRQLSLDRPVAIKVMRVGLGDEGARRRFQREARSMARIEHPNVVAVYGFGEAEGYPYIAMRYVEGETLAERIHREGSLEWREVLRILRGVADGLREAYVRGVVHRDLKPSNILLDRRGRPIVADFGLARPVVVEGEGELTGDQTLLGTPHYMAPELACGEGADHRSDMYALGVMLYEMVTGRRPHEGRTPYEVMGKKLTEGVPPVSGERGGVPRGVDGLIQWLTAADPRERPSEYGEILERIDGIEQSGEGEVEHSGEPGVAARTQRRWGLAVIRGLFQKNRRALGLLAVLVALILLWWCSRPPSTSPPGTARGRAPQGLAVAVAPFSGPDEESVRQGKVMAALIERELTARVGWVRVIGPKAVGTPVTSHDEARKVAGKLGVRMVVWGEALAFGQHTEVQPHLTVVEPPAKKKKQQQEVVVGGGLGGGIGMPVGEGEPTTTVIPMGSANEIELARTSASQVGQLVQTVAINFLLADGKHAREALYHLDRLPQNAQTLLLRGSALVQLGREDEAIGVLLRAGKLDPGRPEPFALLGDIFLKKKRWPDATAAFEKANATGRPYTTRNGLLEDGLLLTAEDWEVKKNQRSLRTLYVLGRDPRSGIVKQRTFLPAIPEAFQREGEETFLVCRKMQHGPLGWRIAWKNHGPDVVVYPPPNLLVRLNSTGSRSCLPVVYNFVGDLGGFDLFEGKIKCRW